MALPTGYTQLSYIESTGTQYIILTQTVQSVFQHVRIELAVLKENQSWGLFGSEQTGGMAFEFWSTSSPIQSLHSFVQSGGTGQGYYDGLSLNQRFVLEKKQDPNNSARINTIIVDGVVRWYSSVNGTLLTTTLHPYLFAINRNDNAVYKGKYRIYDVVIYNDDETEAVHLVPARRQSDGELGVYDTVNDLFLGNAGSGSFLTEAIPAPGSITVSDGVTVGRTVSISWSASSAEGAIYELERSVNGGALSQIYSGGDFFYSDTAASGWTSVQYRVRANSDSGVSSWVTSPVRSVVDPSAPTTPNFAEEYQAYLAGLEKPFKKIVRLEFLQPDDTVAFALGGVGQKVPVSGRDTRTFLQSGSVSVSLANGSRRKASVMLGNRDGAFDYAVNKLWFGQRVRLLMGMRLPNGEDFYFPMGVFYIENPSVLFSPAEKTATLNLTDKWAYLDGTLFGNLEAAYSVSSGTNIFSAIDSLIHMDRFTQGTTSDVQRMIDPTTAVYTTYFNGKTYLAARSDGSISANIAMTDAPYTITENRGSTMGALILKLNEMLAGWIGYDGAGALRLEPSQDDIDDADKPVLFAFTPENSVLLSHSSVSQNTAVYNDVTIAGQGLTNAAVWARAINADPASDTNVNLIGRRVFVEEKSDYWNTDQCAALARWTLKRKTVLQKSVTIECGQMFHLIENRLVSVKRVDKPGSPVEKHLIQGFTIPIGETGSMSITATSVTDIPDFTITTSVS
jgi:hypothetical protein